MWLVGDRFVGVFLGLVFGELASDSCGGPTSVISAFLCLLCTQLTVPPCWAYFFFDFIGINYAV